MAEENITTSKIVYGAQSANDFIDRSFTELFKTKDPINLNRFFSMYDDLFYNIPKTGDQSHTTLINKSQDYVNNYQNPLQVEVDSLREEIIRLTEQINETEDENPFYSNGTILAPMDDDGSPYGHDIHYMDRGLARKLVGMYNGDVFIALKASLGFPYNTPYDDVVLAVPQSIIDGLDKGPKLDIEDIAYPKAIQEEQRLQANIEQQNSIAVNELKTENWYQRLSSGTFSLSYLKLYDFRKDIYDSIHKSWTQERQLEKLRNEYLNDIKYGYTEEERANGQLLLDQLLGNISSTGKGSINKLNATRDKLVILKRIYDIIKPSIIRTVNNEDKLATDTFRDNIINLVNTPITNSDRQFFEGKWSDEYFEELFPMLGMFIEIIEPGESRGNGNTNEGDGSPGGGGGPRPGTINTYGGG